MNQSDYFVCECKGTGGNPSPANVTWYKNGTELARGEKKSTLIRSNVSIHDNGMYRCEAKSQEKAKNETSIELIVTSEYALRSRADLHHNNQIIETYFYNSYNFLDFNLCIHSISETPKISVNCSRITVVNEDDYFACECKGTDGNPPADVTLNNQLRLIQLTKSWICQR